MIVGQRQPRVECPAFLAFVRRKPCCACGKAAPSQAAHLRMTDAAHHEKRHVGIAEKPSDRWCNPLCVECHLDAPEAQHKIGEKKFWAKVGIDPFANATKLWVQFMRRRTRSPQRRERVVKRAKRIKRRRATPPPNAETAKTWNLHPCMRCGRVHRRGACPDRPKRKWASRPFPKGRKLRSQR